MASRAQDGAPIFSYASMYSLPYVSNFSVTSTKVIWDTRGGGNVGARGEAVTEVHDPVRLQVVGSHSVALSSAVSIELYLDTKTVTQNERIDATRSARRRRRTNSGRRATRGRIGGLRP